GNLAVAELNNVVLDPVNNILIGGTQDNGSQEQVKDNPGTWRVLENQGDGNSHGVAVEPKDTAAATQGTRYSFSNTLTMFQRRRFDGNNVPIGPTETDLLKSAAGGPRFSGLSVADRSFRSFDIVPLAVNAVDPQRLLLGYFDLYESADQADTVSTVEVSLKPAESRITAIAYGGKTPDGAAVPFVGYVAAGRRIWVRENDPKASFTEGGLLPGAGTITSIVMDPENWETAYAVDDKHLFVTTDHGVTWTDITGAPARNGALPADGLWSVELAKVTTGGVKSDVLLVGGVGRGFRGVDPLGRPSDGGHPP